MEAELRSAVTEYRAQLTSLEEILSEDQENTDVKEVYEQLQGALSYTLAALDEQQQQQQQETCGNAGATGVGDGVAPAENEGGDEGAHEASAHASPGVITRPRGGAPNNARMHPANLYYNQEPDFAALAREYDELRPYVTTDSAGRAHLDSTSWAATRALTACLLRHDFGLTWWLPAGQLVAPVTNRANYIHWVNDLLHLSSPEDAGVPVRGLDIGCGANFIYCLLGAVLYGWNMVGVDVTQVAVRCCRKLIADNPQVASLLEVRDLSHLHPELQGPDADAAAPAGSVAPGGGRRGRKGGAAAAPSGAAHCSRSPTTPDKVGAGVSGEVHEAGYEGLDATDVRSGAVAAEEAQEAAGAAEVVDRGCPAAGNQLGILVPAFLDETETFAFTMCNPPFFEDMQEAAQNPNTAFGGTAAEMVCPGGELAFVLQMLVESESMLDRVHWFSTMVGKKNTLKAIRRELHSRHVTALRTTELVQGKTSRWAVAWSWQVHPNKASQPLRRLEGPAAAAHAVTATKPPRANGDAGSGGTAAKSADAAAAAPRTGAAAATVSGHPKTGAAASLANSGMPLLPRRHVSFTVQQTGSLSSRTVLQEVRRVLQEEGYGTPEVDAASWTVTWPLQVGPFNSGSGAVDRGLKRPRESGDSWDNGIKVRLRIAQQQRGRLELVATIPNDAPDAAAHAFTGLMAALENGLTANAGAR